MDALDTVPAVASHRAPRSPRTRRASLALATAVATLLTGGVVVGLAPAAHADGSDNAVFLSHLNSLRAAHGLRGLALTSDLTSIATAHSAAMMAKQTIFHNASLTSEVSNWQVLGENVGMGGSAAAIDTAFDNSPEHYANEVSSAYTQVGIGTARDTRGYLYVTLDFRKPMSAAPAPRPPAPKPVVQAPAPKPIVKMAPPKAPAGTTRQTVTRQAAPPAAASTFPGAAAPLTTHSPATTPASTGASAAAAAATTAARQAPTVVPVTPTGSDPVASALAFSRLLAGMH